MAGDFDGRACFNILVQHISKQKLSDVYKNLSNQA